MKGILIGIALFLLVLVAAMAGGMFYLGIAAEKQYKALMQTISKNSGITVIEKKYRRGFLLSRAETELRLSKSPLKVIISSTIHHGPVAVDDIVQGRYGEIRLVTAKINSSATLVGVPENKATDLEIPFTTTIGILGNGETRLSMPKNTYKLATGRILHWQQLQASYRFDRELKSSKTSLRIPLLRIKRAKGNTIRLTQIRNTADMHLNSRGTALGKQNLAIAKVEAGPLFSASKLNVTTKSKETGKNINIAASYRVGDINLLGEQYGPGLLVVDIRKLDADAIAKFGNAINAMHKKGMNPQQETIKIMQQGMQLMAALAKRAPELEISKLNFKTKNGVLNGKAKFILDGRNKNIAGNPLLLFTTLKGRAMLSIPPSMIKPFLATYIYRDIERYKQQGKFNQDEIDRLTPEVVDKIILKALPNYLERNRFTRHLKYDGSSYSMTARLADGQFFINGQPWQFRIPSLK